ncbi:hypothetical protein Bbelb_159910 [Branchiostoma belcheri]|nr:hypothetical protein Bbelb_159910 [Branchiostoma belcheri]
MPRCFVPRRQYLSKTGYDRHRLGEHLTDSSQATVPGNWTGVLIHNKQPTERSSSAACLFCSGLSAAHRFPSEILQHNECYSFASTEDIPTKPDTTRDLEEVDEVTNVVKVDSRGWKPYGKRTRWKDSSKMTKSPANTPPKGGDRQDRSQETGLVGEILRHMFPFLPSHHTWGGNGIETASEQPPAGELSI